MDATPPDLISTCNNNNNDRTKAAPSISSRYPLNERSDTDTPGPYLFSRGLRQTRIPFFLERKNTQLLDRG